MQVFNAKSQQLEDVVWSVDANNEIVCTFADGHFYKFPGGLTQEELKAQVDALQASNEGQEIITPEMEAAAAEERAANEELVNSLNGNTMPAGDQTNAPAEPTTPTDNPTA